MKGRVRKMEREEEQVSDSKKKRNVRRRGNVRRGTERVRNEGQLGRFVRREREGQEWRKMDHTVERSKMS